MRRPALTEELLQEFGSLRALGASHGEEPAAAGTEGREDALLRPARSAGAGFRAQQQPPAFTRGPLQIILCRN